MRKLQTQVFPASDCLCAVYARKHPVLPGAPPETVAMVDIGRLQTTVVLANFGGPAAGAAGEGAGTDESGAADAEGKKTSAAAAAAAVCSYSVLAVRSDEDLGAFNFDNKMFRHFQGVVSQPASQPARSGSALFCLAAYRFGAS